MMLQLGELFQAPLFHWITEFYTSYLLVGLRHFGLQGDAIRASEYHHFYLILQPLSLLFEMFLREALTKPI